MQELEARLLSKSDELEELQAHHKSVKVLQHKSPSRCHIWLGQCVSVQLEALVSVVIPIVLQEEQAMEVAALKDQIRSKEEEWKADKASMDSIAKDADKKHQQLADRTALV